MPADVNIHWYLPPLILGISLVYSATRYESLSLIFRHTVRWIGYILSFLVGTYLLMYLITLDLPTWIYVIVGGVVFFFTFFGGRSSVP